ncbi:hypothetical protein EYC84_007495 [Monilinia fructicola]|uniref:Uncharacterized protein n=1 Tax=Monilinia fructicola TaxID=38448 RepID=A0A5M9JJD2_MONFR|nr:hypothetical protein EYC84_007495 [Monilinia fructicola]
MAGKKKKKRMGAYASSRPSAGSISRPALKIGDQSHESKDIISKPQEVEDVQSFALSQPPIMGDEDCFEDCIGSESDIECFLDDDMDLLPSGWGKDDKSNEDHERAQIAAKAKLKKAKILASVTRIEAAYGNRTATILDHKVDLPQTLVEVTKSFEVMMDKEKSFSKAPCEPVENAVNENDEMIHTTTNNDGSFIGTESRSYDFTQADIKSNSQALVAIKCNACIRKSTKLEMEPNTRLVEKFARQERDLKSAKTQAGSLRAEIEVLNQKHRLEMQKQSSQLSEAHQKEIDAIKSNLKKTEAALQKSSTDLRNVRDKNSLVRTERRELDSKLVAMNEDVARLTEHVSKLEIQKKQALDSTESSVKSLNESIQDFKTSEFRLGVKQRENAMLQNQVTGLIDQNRRIRQQQARSATTSTRLQQLERKYDSLKDDYYTLEDKHSELVEDAARYRCERERYRDDAEYYRKKRDNVRNELRSIEQKLSSTTTTYTNLLQNSKRVRQDYQKLKKTHDLGKPLVKIGVDIRLRFLDQARETVLNISRDKADVALRNNGNIAAHRGNAAADAALFKGGFIPEEFEDAEEVFTALYQCESSQYSK